MGALCFPAAFRGTGCGLLLVMPLLSGCSSPLVRAARDGQAEQVRVLLPSEKNRCGEALRAAASNNREPAVKALLDGGCDVNAKDKDGYTPLMMAAANGHDDVVRLLLLRKADADLVTWNDKTAAMLSTENRHKDTARLIENLDRSLNPEVAAMVAAGPPASGGFLDSVLDAAASGAAQSMIQQAASGKMPDMNSLAQGALRGALNGDTAGPSQGLLNAAAGGAVGGAMRNLGKNPQSMLRAAATGAAVDAAGDLLTGSLPPGSAEGQQSLAQPLSEDERPATPPATPPAAKSYLKDDPAGGRNRVAAGGAVPPRQVHKTGFRAASGQVGHDEMLALVRRCAQNNVAWNLPGSLRQAVQGQLKIGSVLGPALDGNARGGVSFDFETSPNGHIERWTEAGLKRAFFMYWIVNPLGDRAGDTTGTIAYFESDMPLPLRRQVIVVTQFVGMKQFKNVYGELMAVPNLKVIAAGATNGYYYIDQDWTMVDGNVEFYFDDGAIAALEKTLKPLDDGTVAAAAAPEPAPAPPVPPAHAEDCAKLTRILASRDAIAARHGEEKAAQVMAAARKRFKEYQCAQ